MLFWLFGASDVPVVLTASSTLPTEGEEAAQNLNYAVQIARQKRNGVYVAYNKKLYSPLNLKFWNKRNAEFDNWNLTEPLFSYEGGISTQFLSVQEPDFLIMASLLNEAAHNLSVVRLYPGLLGFRLEKMLCESHEYGIKTIILELYASGTGNMRHSDYSLKPLLLNGRKHGITFYATSQQECSVDFSEYSTSADVWRNGAVPMGILTTESVVALYFASCLIADNYEELEELMETGPDYL